MNKLKSIALALSLFLSIHSATASDKTEASLSFSGDVSLVSTYIWRGMKQFNGAAIQGSANLEYKFISGGIWYSSFSDIPTLISANQYWEVDPYLTFSIPMGEASASIGANYYAYTNSFGDGVVEALLGLEYKFLGITGFITPKQKNSDFLYWISLSAAHEFKALEVSGSIDVGDYSSPDSDVVGFITLSISKSITDALSINWNGSFPYINFDQDVSYWMGISYGF